MRSSAAHPPSKKPSLVGLGLWLLAAAFLPHSSFAFPPVVRPRVPFPGASIRSIIEAEPASKASEDPNAPCPCTTTPAKEPSKNTPPSQNPKQSSPDIAIAVPTAIQVAPPAHRKIEKKRILILGDSLALCGFGKTLDARLRSHPQVDAVSTIMACGTLPSSWLKTGPYAAVKTACGFWTIEGKTEDKPTESMDVYGMTRGHKPAAHPVPKIESLLEAFHPDLLVVQCGTNLLGLFSDGKTLLPERHDSQIRSHLAPLRSYLASQAPPLAKIFWVAPPVSGRYTPEIQDFLVEKLTQTGNGLWQVIDSRQLISYPYRGTFADKEHFLGQDMTAWAEAVFKILEPDLASDSHPRPAQSPSLPLPNPQASLSSASAIKPSLNPTPQTAPPNPPKAATSSVAPSKNTLSIKATLLRKSPPLALNQILPYQESMVGFLYRVDDVLSGSYPEKEILVMHPAHIRLQDQSLSKFQVSKSYSLTLIELEGSLWESCKKSDRIERAELIPYILAEDEARSPLFNR